MQTLSSAKSLRNALVRLRRLHPIGRLGLILIRPRQNLNHPIHYAEIVFLHGRLDRLFYAVISRRHGSLQTSPEAGFKEIPFKVTSRWFEGRCNIHSYELDELLGTKFRALYQRKQGRDLFDLATALANPVVKPDRVIAAFLEYMKQEGHKVSRAQFEKNIAAKLHDPAFVADISPLLSEGFTWDIETAAPLVSKQLIERLPGDPWKGAEK